MGTATIHKPKELICTASNDPVMVASENGRRHDGAMVSCCARAAARLDAVEPGCRIVEDDPDDHKVWLQRAVRTRGSNSTPASWMGALQAGAVAAVQGVTAVPSRWHRRVMETPHVLVVRGAERLAVETGETPQEQRGTEEALRRWRERFAERPRTGQHGQSARGGLALTRPVNLHDRRDDDCAQK